MYNSGELALFPPFICILQYRHRTVLQPSKYAGRRCTGSLWDLVECVPTGTCAVSQNCGNDFRCEESGEYDYKILNECSQVVSDETLQANMLYLPYATVAFQSTSMVKQINKTC